MPPVERQQIVKRIIPCHHADHIHDHVANADIEHQVGDALVSVPQAEPLKVSAQIFQKDPAPSARNHLQYNEVLPGSLPCSPQ